ncbi:MAG: DNA polymerase III subunit alpha [Firmicutes bacterium]|nr:DNA polymerase III subunit alpha [Bacillota bacterium]
MVNFELFIQTGYSFNGSMIDIERLVIKAKKEGFSALGIADLNNMYGAIKFYKACKNNGIIPLLGLQCFVDSDGFSRLPIVMFGLSSKGYSNLIHISSKQASQTEPLKLQELSPNLEGIAFVLITSQGPIYQALMDEDYSLAAGIHLQIKRQLKDVYLGLDINDFGVEMKIAPHLESIGKTIIMNQVNYMEKSDRLASKILKSILNDQKQLDDGLFNAEDNDFEFKSPNTLEKMYSNYENAIENTKRLIDSCDLTIDFSSIYLPKYPIDKEYTAKDYLKALSKKGLEIRLRNKKTLKVDRSVYFERLDDELNIINKMGYEDYFLIVWDFVLYAKKKNILVGPGRGSAAGSLVAYVLGIVDIDPLDFDLYFERFLNPERITMPDIDLDFPDDKRDEVIQYVVSKYGHDHVVSIITFGTFQGKSALRDTARILKVPESVVSEITSYIGETNNSIDEFINTHEKQYSNLMQNKEISFLFDIASKLVGLPRHVSTHAAGIIITDLPITNYAPVQPGLAGMFQTQYEASDLENLGLLKIDFLGLRNLTTIQNVLDLIQQNTKEVIDIYKIPYDDANTFELLKQVNTLGIFQLESTGMMNLLREMQIEEFEDISTCIALFRPGPMESIPSFIKRRNKKEKVSFLHEDLKPILESTEGIIVYQEQIMKIANVFAGYSLGEADVLRRAVSKKKETVLQEERAKFIDSCIKNHRDEKTSNQIYDLIVKFANYGFNKSHSVVYSLVAYWMAYLKANYPTFFMAELLDSSIGSQRATNDYIKECRKLGITVLPPDINLSDKHYRFEKNHLRYPYLGVKNVGSIVADKLVSCKGNEPFASFLDFMRRAKEINSRVIESMIMIGMFDQFNLTKRTMIENLKQITAFQSIPQMAKEEDFVYITYDEYDFDTLQKAEKELIGFNLRFHPITQFQSNIDRNKIDTVTDVWNSQNNNVHFLGALLRLKVINTKKGDEMAFLTFEDQFSQIECVLFNSDYIKYKSMLEKEQLYLITGKKEERSHKIQVIVDHIQLWKGDI